MGYLNNSKPEQVTFPDTPFVDYKRLQGSFRECYAGMCVIAKLALLQITVER